MGSSSPDWRGHGARGSGFSRACAGVSGSHPPPPPPPHTVEEMASAQGSGECWVGSARQQQQQRSPHSDSVPPSGLGTAPAQSPRLLPTPGPGQGPLRAQSPMAGAQTSLLLGEGSARSGEGGASSSPAAADPGLGGEAQQEPRWALTAGMPWGCTLCQLPSPRDPCGPPPAPDPAGRIPQLR